MAHRARRMFRSRAGVGGWRRRRCATCPIRPIGCARRRARRSGAAALGRLRVALRERLRDGVPRAGVDGAGRRPHLRALAGEGVRRRARQGAGREAQGPRAVPHVPARSAARAPGRQRAGGPAGGEPGLRASARRWLRGVCDVRQGRRRFWWWWRWWRWWRWWGRRHADRLRRAPRPSSASATTRDRAQSLRQSLHFA